MIPRKVVAYITRPTPAGGELLVHEHRDHPGAGVQVPTGAVEPGEAVLDALFREIAEESGLTRDDLALIAPVTEYCWWNPSRHTWQHRHVFHLRPTRPLPDAWPHTITGAGEDANLVFLYRWLPIDQAADTLAADLGLHAAAVR